MSGPSALTSTWPEQHARLAGARAHAPPRRIRARRTTSTEARTILAVCGVVAIDRAMITLVTDAPSTALTVMARRMEGNAIRASIRRMIGLSRARK
jgi:hypothetical protein